MAPAGCCGSRRRASSRERSRRIGPGGGWRPAVNGPGRLLRGRAGVCSRAAVHARGLVPRLLCPVSRLPRPVPVPASTFYVFRVPRSAFRVLRPAPHARVFRLLHFVPAFPVFCCPRPVARVLRPASCVLRPASCVLHPVPPCPRPRPRVPRFASCAPRPRLPCSAPAPRTPRPCPWLRLLRPADGCPCSAPCLPPRTSGQVLPASASRRDEKKIGRFTTGTSRFCMHCSGASYSRLRIISPPW